MLKKKERIVRYKSPINLNAGIVIFGLISIYLFINIVIYFTTERTSYYEVVAGSNSEEVNTTFTGIAIRDEIIKYADTSGYIDYYVREGSRISNNTTLYSIDSTGQLDELLSKTASENSNLTEENINTISDLLYDFSNNFDEMNFSDTYNFKSSIKGTVVDLINMNSLQKLAKESGDSFSINKAGVSGIVLYRVDDYETLTSKELKATDFDKVAYTSAKFSSGDKVEKSTPIYKAVNDEQWSIAVPLTKAQIKKYKKITGIKLKFLKDGLTTTANFEIIKGADNKKYGIISLAKYMVRYVNDRFLDVQIIDDTITGLKIPKSSLVTKSLYVIPKKYGAVGGDSEKIGFNRQMQTEGKTTNEFYYPTIAYSDKNNYYVSTKLFEEGDILIAMDSTEVYSIGKTQDFIGVYNINNGYTVFVRINILDTTDEYYIVESGDTYGLAVYDRIVLDGNSVSENQIIFQ